MHTAEPVSESAALTGQWVLRWESDTPGWGNLAIDHPQRPIPRFAGFVRLDDPLLQHAMHTRSEPESDRRWALRGSLTDLTTTTVAAGPQWVLRWEFDTPGWGNLAIDHPQRPIPRFAGFVRLDDPLLQHAMHAHPAPTSDRWCEIRVGLGTEQVEAG